uniref:Serine protease 52 n=1 Tax=Lygus hesperus TaxID=30085 RepID=A0A0A9WJW4_LYGHE
MASTNLFDVSALLFWILVASQVSSRPQEREKRAIVGYPGSIYSFPYLCTLAYGTTKAVHYVSACTIVQKKFAVASLDSMNVKVADDVIVHGVKFWYQAIFNLHVLTGPFQLYPNVRSDWSEKDAPVIHDKTKTRDHYADVSKLINLHIPIVENLESENISSVKRNQDSFDDLIFGAYGLALNIGLLETVGFVWSAFTLPAPLRSPDKDLLRRMEWDHINELEYHSYSQKTCVVGTWKVPSYNLAFHSVIYVPKQQCRESYCAHDIRSCMRFPLNPNTVCFKSIIYSDLCPSDRGGALYCNNYGKSIFAILTTALNCGAQNLPCVFTLASKVVEMVKLVQGRMDDPIDYSKYVVTTDNDNV